MKKKIISALISTAMLMGMIPSVGTAQTTGSSSLDTTANQNLIGISGEQLIDDTYQYCVEGDTYFAYLWVPETAQHLNGVMVAKSNLSEARLMESKTVRTVLSKYNIGVVYIHARNTTENPGANAAISNLEYRYGEKGEGYNAGAMLDEIMARFASVSGYDELRYTPFIGAGHSAGMGPGSSLGSWDPTRVIAQICMKGGTKMGIPGVTGSEYAGDYETQPGVPTYYEAGQFTEHAGYDNPAGKDNYIDGETKNLTKIRQKGIDRLLSMSVEWEAGHYDWSEESNEMMAAYLDEVIPLRLGEQAVSQKKIPEDYVLEDLSDSGYVADVKMFGTRTVEYDESEYAHGAVSEFSEAEQKNMIWFPSENLYQIIRNFTNNRKDLVIEAPESNSKTAFASYETQFSTSTGAIKSGNYVRYDNGIMFVFDTDDMNGEYPVDRAALSFNVYHGNTSRSFKLVQYNEAQDGTTIAIPSEENSTVVSATTSTGSKISIDVTNAIKAAISDGTEKVYFALSITDEEKAAYEESVASGSITSGYPSPYHGSDMYLSTTNGADDTNRVQMNISYRTDSTRIYPDIDKAFGEESGNPNWWQGDLHYLATGYDIMLGFDMSKVDDTKELDMISLSLTRTVGYGGHSTNVYLMSENPWESGAYNPDVVAVVTDDDLIATYDGNSVVLDLTESLVDKTGMVYLLLKYADQEDTSQSGNDYYSDSVTGTSYNSVATEDAQRPQLILTYADSEEPTEAPIVTKHQYIQMEDPSTKAPKPFTRITRYDAMGPNNDSYAEGLEDDPMSFAMYVDKMNVVSPDHLGAGSKVANVSDSPAVITALMAPVEWIGIEQVEISESDAENNVSTKWKNILRWKNNRLFYRNPAQDSYMTLNAFDCYDEDGNLEFAYTTNAFMIYPLFVSGGGEQHIIMPEISDVDKDFDSFTIKPESSAGLVVDLMVEYGPVKALRQQNGSYTIIPEQIPAGAQYPIECKLVATQFGVNNNGVKINTAEPVEKVFYITDNSELSALPLNGEINQNVLLKNEITGFNVEGSGSITLRINSDTKFNAEQAAVISAERKNSDDAYYAMHYQYPEDYNPYDYWEEYPGEWTVEVKESGFVPLSAFTNGDKANINLRYLNEIVSEGITSITPVTEQAEIVSAKANSWGDGVNIVCQKPQGDAYDSVKVYVKDGEIYREAQNVVIGETYALVKGLSAGKYEFKLTTVKDGVESEGIEVIGTTDKYSYTLEDFELGDLTSGMNWLSSQDIQPAYAWTTATGAALVRTQEDDGNHYLECRIITPLQFRLQM